MGLVSKKDLKVIGRKLKDPLGLKEKRQNFEQMLEEALFYKKLEYQNAGNDTICEKSLPLGSLKNTAKDSTAANSCDSFEDLLDKFQKAASAAMKKGSDIEGKLCSTLSPEIIAGTKSAFLKGSFLTKDGRILKLTAFKELGKGLISPMFLLHLSSFLIADDINQGAVMDELKSLNAMMTKKIQDDELDHQAALENYADRLFFYINHEGELKDQDLRAIEEMEIFFARETLKCASLLRTFILEKPKSHLRDWNEAKAVCLRFDKTFYQTVEKTILTAFLYTLSLILAKRRVLLEYVPSWSLEDKIISPLEEILSFVHAQILCRLKYLEESIKLNPFDKVRLRKLRKEHESSFLLIEDKFIKFLTFYRSKTMVTIDISENKI